MSNLYKQWYVRTETENTRVINSNAIMTEFLEKNIPVAENVPSEQNNGFMEGILQEAENVIKAEPVVDEVQLAREEAERILTEAKSQAAGILARAEAEKEGIRNAAEQEGYARGEQQMQREIEQRKMELQALFDKKYQELDSDYTKKRADMEKDLVDVIVEVFNKVFHIQFDNKKHILMHLIDDAILNIEGEKRFRIKVAESNVLFLENHKDEIMDRVGHDIELEFVTDVSMDGNACVIETDSGVFDCSLGAQLENLIKDIRSLCS